MRISDWSSDVCSSDLIGDIEQNLAKFSLTDRQIPIRVSIEESERKSLSVIENLPVPTTSGGSVPLKVVADVSFGSGPPETRRYNQVRSVVIAADLAPGAVSGDVLERMMALPATQNLPAGVREVKFGDGKRVG